MKTTAWTVYMFFDKKINRELKNIRPSLHFYGMIILLKKGSVLRNGMAAIPKTCFEKLKTFPKFCN